MIDIHARNLLLTVPSLNAINIFQDYIPDRAEGVIAVFNSSPKRNITGGYCGAGMKQTNIKVEIWFCDELETEARIAIRDVDHAMAHFTGKKEGGGVCECTTVWTVCNTCGDWTHSVVARCGKTWRFFTKKYLITHS